MCRAHFCYCPCSNLNRRENVYAINVHFKFLFWIKTWARNVYLTYKYSGIPTHDFWKEGESKILHQRGRGGAVGSKTSREAVIIISYSATIISFHIRLILYNQNQKHNLYRQPVHLRLELNKYINVYNCLQII